MQWAAPPASAVSGSSALHAHKVITSIILSVRQPALTDTGLLLKLDLVPLATLLALNVWADLIQTNVQCVRQDCI